MFGWLKPTCPCDRAAQAWVDEQLDWLGDEFAGGSRRPRPVAEPTDEFFPDRYDRSPAAVRTMLERVCEFMDADPDRIRMQLYSESRNPVFVNAHGDQLPGTAGLYQETGTGFLIRLEKAQIDEPMLLVGTMAHELAHARLLGEDRVVSDRFDHELLTDLTAVYFGFGVFLANSPRDWVSTYGTWPGTGLRRPEYMNLPMLGYALAQVARRRGEDKPKWARHLRPAARAVFKQGMRFLAAGG